MTKKLLLLTFAFLSLFSYSQDLIIKKDSSRVLCKIVREDSLTFYYEQYKNRMTISSSIQKSEVRKAFYAKRPSQASNNSAVNNPDAPENKQRFIFHFMAGGAFPLGKYSKKDLTDSTSGFAKNGFAFSISATVKLTRIFGISAGYFSQQNSFDDKTLFNAIAVLNNSQYGVSTTTWASSSTSYKMQGLYVGPYFSAPIKNTKGLSIDISEMIGYPSFTSPQINYQETFPSTGDYRSIQQGTASVNSFGLISTLGLRYNITKNIGIAIDVSFLFAKPKFTNVLINETESYYGTTYSNTSVSNYSQSMTSYTIKGGIVFLINKKSTSTSETKAVSK